VGIRNPCVTEPLEPGGGKRAVPLAVPAARSAEVEAVVVEVALGHTLAQQPFCGRDRWLPRSRGQIPHLDKCAARPQNAHDLGMLAVILEPVEGLRCEDRGDGGVGNEISCAVPTSTSAADLYNRPRLDRRRPSGPQDVVGPSTFRCVSLLE
jgi:hypothetical protein